MKNANGAGYTITETQPAAYLDGKLSKGLVNGVTCAACNTTVANVISAIPFVASSVFTAFDFGEVQAAGIPGYAAYSWSALLGPRGVPAEVFFTAESDKGHRRDAHEENAKKICRGCPVLQHCRDYAVAADEPYGIWGATTPQERRALRRSPIPSPSSHRRIS